ncbi:DUF1499 domain-containing protein [Neorhodopirellula lusitana]|uniref:DUF1499 domain-containing protein n=1 Tax=Neorhodopirellula lusitana TaxID=445327 RepID=UPI00384FAA3E
MQFLALVPYLLILAGSGLSYVGMLPAMFGWSVSALGVLSGLGMAATIIFAGSTDLWWAAGIAVLPSVVAIPMVINDLRYPRINDVATNVDTPPEFVTAFRAAPNRGRDMSFPVKNGPMIRKSYPNIRPLTLDELPERAFERIATLAKNQPNWVITRFDVDAFTLEGEAATSCFRFIDDFIIQVSNHKGKAQINMRSKSRDGLVDAGENAKRIETFFEQLSNPDVGAPHDGDRKTR